MSAIEVITQSGPTFTSWKYQTTQQCIILIYSGINATELCVTAKINSQNEWFTTCW